MLEVGCGTARNLRLLAQMQPAAHYFGLDASQRCSGRPSAVCPALPRAGASSIKRAMAESFVATEMFEGAEPLDAVFFSYALTMIPPWRESLAVGWEKLRPGGRLLAVDFWDAGGLPRWCGRLLHGWLGQFHTHPQAGIIPALEGLPGGGPAQVNAVGPRYAFLASRRKH